MRALASGRGASRASGAGPCFSRSCICGEPLRSPDERPPSRGAVAGAHRGGRQQGAGRQGAGARAQLLPAIAARPWALRTAQPAAQPDGGGVDEEEDGMNLSIQETRWLVTETCASCGIEFAMPANLRNSRKRDLALFYCPNGHSQAYTESEADRLTRDLAAAEQRIEAGRCDLAASRTEAERLGRIIA